MMDTKHMVLAVTVLSGLGCAQAPAVQPPQPAPQPAPAAAAPVPEAPTFPSPTKPAPAPAASQTWLPPSAARQSGPTQQPGYAQGSGWAQGAARYGGAMGYQGGANMTSWPDTNLRNQLFQQLLGPAPARTGQGGWGASSNRARNDYTPFQQFRRPY